MKLNSKGFAHHFIIPVIAIVAVAGIGAYVISRSKAATIVSGVSGVSGPVVVSSVSNPDTPTPTPAPPVVKPSIPNTYNAKCGYLFVNGGVWNIKYSNNPKNSYSTRNLARELCLKNFLPSATALKINKSGDWGPEMQAALKNFQKSRNRLKENPTGLPNAKTICLLGENVTQVKKVDTYKYTLRPYDFGGKGGTDCPKLLGHKKNASHVKYPKQ